ncbi:MAG: DNA-directed RNA polymerase subunit beta' [Deltaproteobacteria bacterium]|nr:DNA-directed RNA polymerase subunit beta' [Deltaproteobacteria bacterium]
MKALNPISEKPTTHADYSAVQIKIASAEEILAWSHGEVKSSETINYRTFKPERDGLFCSKIFGPIHDYECNCGKYKRMKHRGITCEKCGVEVIQSKVRRERLGHIKLACPVSHVWFLKGVPSRIGNLLDITLRDLERVLYFDAYVVLDPGSSTLLEKEILEEEKYREIRDEFPDLRVGMGAESIRELLQRIDLISLSETLYTDMREVGSEAKRKKVVKRLKIVESFRKSGNDPASMILDVIPVLSPELRPLVPLEGGRFATSDLNDLYRRVIHRNNRLKRLIDLRAPDLIVRNEKRMLQEAVDALFDNGRRGRPIMGNNKRPLKSLSDMLKGKQGRFRQNLLGKRVDYSGRTVIVVGPDLKLNQCGLPKVMALELFKPFIFHMLMEQYEVPTIKVAKKMVEEQRPEVWEVLDEVIVDHPVLLNRAPTLHRLGIQAFEPILVEGKALKLHPLVCTAFNADFDGDQMAVHVPLSVEAQLEAKVLMMATNNVLSPANGKPIMTPTQDMVLGLYWLTKELAGSAGEGKTFYTINDVRLAFDHGKVDQHAKIKFLIHKELVETTVGRVLLYDVIPKEIPFAVVNRQLKKKEMGSLVDLAYRLAGNRATVAMVDDLKRLGFMHATQAGFSICIDDMTIPERKAELLAKAEEEVVEVRQQYVDGLITEGERYNKVIDIWARLTDRVAEEMLTNLSKVQDERGHVNSIFVMVDSGARGSTQQMKQLAGMRGLMAKPSGEIMETPITANFREGLSVVQYFISTHGARKGLADTALKTANSGYLTRRLVDVAQDGVVTATDCGTVLGLEMSALVEAGEIIETLGDRILGRVALEDIVDLYRGDVLVVSGDEIDEDKVQLIEDAGIESVHIRSVLTCEMDRGVCSLCYGRDLGRGRMVSIGEAVGVIAAQSIGEPGTQLTMRTFHIGGAANQRVQVSKWEAKYSGRVDLTGIRLVQNRDGLFTIMNRKAEARIMDPITGREMEARALPVGANMRVAHGDTVKQGQEVAEWDPFATPILSDVSGIIRFNDIIDGVTMREQLDAETGLSRRVILDHMDSDRRPEMSVRDSHGRVIKNPDTNMQARFFLPAKAELMVEEGAEIHAADILARIPRETAKNKDITGGLPRVAELFEARIPKEPSIISEIDGSISFGKDVKRKQKVVVTPEHGESKEYLIPRGKHIIVHEGDHVRAGEPIVDGPANPHDILAVLGPQMLQKYLVDEVQEVYRLQGVSINDKHIEIIVRQMMKQVRVTDPGDTTYLINEQVTRQAFDRKTRDMLDAGQKPPSARPVLQGITKAALSTESFISAASFQETTKVLTEASINAKVDTFRGLKENVIMGRLIPSGTGLLTYRRSNYRMLEEPPYNLVVKQLEEASQ